MKRSDHTRTILFACALAISFIAIRFAASSAPVDSVALKQVVRNFYMTRVGNRAASANLSPQLVYTGKALAPQSGDSIACYQIYNIGNGFVIISTDDRTNPILGYSTEGCLDIRKIPIQLQELLQGYASELQVLLAQPAHTDAETAAKWRALASGSTVPTRHEGHVIVSPLVQTRWNQDAPYNALCPADTSGPGGHTFTGCVATAMAQIIRYWQFPPHGLGSHSYVADFASAGYGNYGTQTVDFWSATYDYSLMPDSVTTGSPVGQINEVAKLMYHCGVSVDMEYGAFSSGAITSQAASALNTFFGYSGCYARNKSQHTSTNWLYTIKNHLDGNRPVIYHGNGPQGGHAFVCDGYTDDDYFHFNFGWSGQGDGYYTLTAICPASHNFNQGHGAIFGIDASNPIIRASADALSFFVEGGEFSAGERVSVITNALTAPLTVTVTGPFAISTDSSHYNASLTFAPDGGTFYVRYEPNSNMETDSGTITIASGSIVSNIALTGSSIARPCLPPQQLTVSTTDPGHVTLEWTTPQIAPDLQTLSWNQQLATNLQYNSNYKRSLLQRFATADLTPYHNKTLTNVSFYAHTNATRYKVVVYMGGSYNNGIISPGTLMREDEIPISSITSDGWHTHVLSQPLTIDATQELWFGVYLEAPGGVAAIPLGPLQAVGKGAIMGLHTSSNVTWSESSLPFSFCVRGTIENRQAISYYAVSIDGNFLDTTTLTTFHDTLASNGTYIYDVTAHWDNGCQAGTSDTITITGLCDTLSHDFAVTAFDAFIWNDSTYTSSGDYMQHFQTAQGCDSIVTLHLTILPVLELSAGWNWISLNIESDSLLTQLMSAVGNNADILKSQTQYRQQQDGIWFGPLNNMTTGQGYMIHMLAAGELRIMGTPADPAATGIGIHPGWNWIGYVPQNSMSLAEAFGNFSPQDGDMVKSQSLSAQYHTGVGWTGSLTTLEPGKMYMYYSNNSEIRVLYYPTGN
ncbi:MAG: C10 family peptidase [Bacteroidales bacterium]|nr:C10 family peptidase [Bacteroidales bacterium]